jgi:HAD superfamily phosphoserine phosphatase-like hydrolase
MTKFIFDLDGTITKQETLPLIAKHFKVEEEIENLTQATINGNIPFIESFIRRVHILGKLPINEIDNLLANVPLYPKIIEFIREHQDNCAIATGNLGCWIEQLKGRIGCVCYHSDGLIENNTVKKLSKILKKENIVERYQSSGDGKVVFIGDGNNDMEAMRIADVSIASGLTHYPAPTVLSIANYLVFTEEALWRQLNQLL